MARLLRRVRFSLLSQGDLAPAEPETERRPEARDQKPEDGDQRSAAKSAKAEASAEAAPLSAHFGTFPARVGKIPARAEVPPARVETLPAHAGRSPTRAGTIPISAKSRAIRDCRVGASPAGARPAATGSGRPTTKIVPLAALRARPVGGGRGARPSKKRQAGPAPA